MLFKQAEPLLQFQIEADQYGADTMAVTKSVEQVLRELGPVLETEKIVLTPNLFRPADFITAGIGNLRTALTMGGVLVVLLLLPLLLFPLFSVRTAFIAVVAIPLVTGLGLLPLALLSGEPGTNPETQTFTSPGHIDMLPSQIRI